MAFIATLIVPSNINKRHALAPIVFPRSHAWNLAMFSLRFHNGVFNTYHIDTITGDIDKITTPNKYDFEYAINASSSKYGDYKGNCPIANRQLLIRFHRTNCLR